MEHDAIIVGSGPNGLAAGIYLAQAGLRVTILEKHSTPGGGARSQALTQAGFLHDVCSAVHPLAFASPFFSTLPLERYGLKWVTPPAALAHPFDDGTAALLYPSLARTAATLGQDGLAYVKLMRYFLTHYDQLLPAILSPLKIHKHLWPLIKFGYRGIRSSKGLAASLFSTDKARTWFAGFAAHSMLPLERSPTAAFGLLLALLGHTTGWPLPVGGAQSITHALVQCFESFGGRIVTNSPVQTWANLPTARMTLLDVTPRQLLRIAGHKLPLRYQKQLQRFQYGPGVFKIDWALKQTIPFAAPGCDQAATLHLGGNELEIAASERAAWQGQHAEFPFVLLVQPSRFDASRAPLGKHTAWAYCHVPHGSTTDMTETIEQQIERFAPGFRSRILARHTMNSQDMQTYNPNYVGGDINGGAVSLSQLFTRPLYGGSPYKTPLKNVYICSSSTPPGGGVHGMCGYYAARVALDNFKRTSTKRIV